jgi:hypothetical protein
LEASVAADPDDAHEEPDWSEAVKGAATAQSAHQQGSAKRALEISAAGGHNLLMVEPIKPFTVRQTTAGEWRLMGELPEFNGIM